MDPQDVFEFPFHKQFGVLRSLSSPEFEDWTTELIFYYNNKRDDEDVFEKFIKLELMRSG